jgi:RND family efflux transporter MFP subunit
MSQKTRFFHAAFSPKEQAGRIGKRRAARGDEGMKAFPWRLVAVLLLLAAAAGGALWWYTQPRKVQTAIATVGPAVEFVYATGVVEPRHPADAGARLTAPVKDVLVRDGDTVRAGQPLILLEDSQQRALLEQARANRVKAERDAVRIQKLFDEGWITRTALDTTTAARDASRAAESAARAQLDQFVIRAGTGGIVLKRDVEPGDLATPGKALLTIGNPGDLWVTATVDERDVPRLVPGQEALMRSDAWPDRVIAGRLLEVTPGGDALQRAFRARILFAHAENVPIGLSLEVNITTHRHDKALLVPQAALADGRVWTIHDGRARKIAVKAGIQSADQVEILSGLKAGERVIVGAPEDLAEGDRVIADVARAGAAK